MEKAEVLRSDVDAKVTIMVADAERNARTTKGEGDAEAAKTYADAYSKNADFFSFVRSMEAYRNSFQNKSDVMIIQPDNEFFKHMQSMSGN
jgi:membrane protease subunit HflC